jgi:ribosomal protein S19E (S16A)
MPTLKLSLAKEYACPILKRKKQKSPSLLKILKTPVHKPTRKHSDNWFQSSILTRIARQIRQKRQGITAPTQKAGFRVPKTVLWLMEH